MYPGWWQDVLAMLLFRMDFQREPTSHEARVEVPGPRLRMRRRSSCSEAPEGQAPAIPNSHGASFARTPRTVMIAETTGVDQNMAPGSPALLSRHPASASTASGAPSALLAHSFRAWASRTFPVAPAKEGEEAFVANLLAQNRDHAASLKRQEDLAASAASIIDTPQLLTPVEKGSVAADQEELGRLRALLATADAERLLLFERM